MENCYFNSKLHNCRRLQVRLWDVCLWVMITGSGDGKGNKGNLLFIKPANMDGHWYSPGMFYNGHQRLRNFNIDYFNNTFEWAVFYPIQHIPLIIRYFCKCQNLYSKFSYNLCQAVVYVSIGIYICLYYFTLIRRLLKLDLFVNYNIVLSMSS